VLDHLISANAGTLRGPFFIELRQEKKALGRLLVHVLADRVFAGGYGPKDAVYRNNGASNRQRQDYRRDWFG
jgi:hypothetical protein